MLNSKSKYDKYLFILLVLTTLVRTIIAITTEFSNDEVYYINYALFPDLSHFDHPPMVGWFINLFTFNYIFQSEFFIRLGAIVSGTITTWLIFKITKKLFNEVSAWYSALLYTASIYAFIIVGTFIMPDSPQSIFWLSSLYFIIKIIDNDSNKYNFLFFGLFAGLALLSKYTSIFIFVGFAIFIILYYKKLLKNPYLYLSIFIAIFVFLPVIIWNYNNEFISLNFHTQRVEIQELKINFHTFLQEIIGQIMYNNLINVFFTFTALVYFFKNRQCFDNRSMLLITIALPMILLFLLFSLFRQTLPHWSSLAYITLIPIVAHYIYIIIGNKKEIIFPKSISSAIILLTVLVLLSFFQIHNGLLLNNSIKEGDSANVKIKDITVELYGWQSLGNQFTELYKNDVANKKMPLNSVIISQRWFPAANIDYYVARNLNLKLYAIGNIKSIHKYAWINQERGCIPLSFDAYFISSYYDFFDPNTTLSEYFNEILPPDTLPITRNGALINQFYVWRLKNLKKAFPDELFGNIFTK